MNSIYNAWTITLSPHSAWTVPVTVPKNLKKKKKKKYKHANTNTDPNTQLITFFFFGNMRGRISV